MTLRNAFGVLAVVPDYRLQTMQDQNAGSEYTEYRQPYWPVSITLSGPISRSKGFLGLTASPARHVL